MQNTDTNLNSDVGKLHEHLTSSFSDTTVTHTNENTYMKTSENTYEIKHKHKKKYKYCTPGAVSDNILTHEIVTSLPISLSYIPLPK